MQSWPRLAAALPPLQRLDGSVQFGLDPATGLRLSGLTEAEIGWVRSLDGGHDPLATGLRAGLSTPRLQLILRLLRDGGLLSLAGPVGPGPLADPGAAAPRETDGPAAPAEQGPDPACGAGRTRARVWVRGPGLTAARVADLLRHDGVGAVERFAALPQLSPRRRNPDLVILLAETPVTGAQARRWLQRGIAHLPVVVAARSATIGPLVRAGGGPCLRCVELGRADRDPSWSTLAAQAQLHPRGPGSDADDGLGAIAAGLAARIATAYVDRAGSPAGVALDVASPWPTVRQHRWPIHPLCPTCGPARIEAAQ